ncbi:hypothetical protein [Helicobacter pylori]|uniref:hypothetical protein n=1 Tax=Helicobacter pylori TaxID=210 RepID=UPI0013DE9D4E|nr:hypothetical protein [Helicobacter pylori]NGP56586.1 hypothetical protein [Helicobacter pylori]
MSFTRISQLITSHSFFLAAKQEIALYIPQLSQLVSYRVIPTHTMSALQPLSHY